MRKLCLWGVLVLLGIVMTACGGGGSSNDSLIPTPEGFTAEMLNAKTYYVTFPAEPDGTKEQDTIVFSGTGPYTVAATEEYFDSNNAFIETDTYTVNVTLNQDGTLTATDDSSVDPATVTLTGKTSTYLEVSGTDGTDTWTERWYFAKPADWLSQGSDPGTTGFTSEMLNATYYVTYDGDAEGTTDAGTTQDTIVISGTGPSYTATVTEEYFDVNSAFVSTETIPIDLVLNQDGTLTATDVSGVTTLTLTSQTSTYLNVHFVNGQDVWDDQWYFAKPAGWLSQGSDPGTTGFTAADFNDSIQYEIWEEPTGTVGVGGWDAMTIQFLSTGAASGAGGIVDPFVAEITGVSWEIDAQGRLHITVPNNPDIFFTLTQRAANHFEVCWGETAIEADSCVSPEFIYTDLAAAKEFVATPPN